MIFVYNTCLKEGNKMKGYPTNLNQRKEHEIIVRKYLLEQDIDYEWIDHKALESMDEYEEYQKYLNCMIPKNLFLANRQQTKFYLLCMPGDKKFLTKEISSQINSARLSFGNEEKLHEYLGCYKGSTSIFGLLFDKNNEVTLLIDSDLLKEECLGFHPCENTSTLKLKTEDVFNKFLKEINRDYQIVNLKGE